MSDAARSALALAEQLGAEAECLRVRADAKEAQAALLETMAVASAGTATDAELAEALSRQDAIRERGRTVIAPAMDAARGRLEAALRATGEIDGLAS